MIKVQVNTPASKDNPAEMTVEEIPLPPPELWPSLDNTALKREQPVASPPTTATPPLSNAQVQFTPSGKQREVVIPLDYPFIADGLGEITQVTVRRLSMGDISDMLIQFNGKYSLFDVYARMTGLPASVIRALIDEDGDRVTDVAYDFLPRVFHPEKDL